MNKLLESITGNMGFPATITGLRGSSAALLAARTALKRHQPTVVITASEEQAALLEQDINLFTDLPVFLYPGYDIPPFTPLSPDPATVAARISTLYQILNTPGPFLLVIPAEALLRRIIPREKLSSLAELVIRGEETDQADLVRRLTHGGYEKVSLVQNPGEFSLRGGILDIFPPRSGDPLPAGNTAKALPTDCPVRLDFFGDLIESIRFFDPISQRSLLELAEFTILPVSDILYPDDTGEETKSPATALIKQYRDLGWDPDETDLLADHLAAGHRFPGIEFLLPLFHDNPAIPLDYLPTDSLLIIKDPLEISRSIELAWERITANHQEAILARTVALPPKDLFLNKQELDDRLNDFPLLNLDDFPAGGAAQKTVEENRDKSSLFHITTGSHTLLRQELEIQRRQKGVLGPLAERIRQWQENGGLVFMACRSTRQAEQLAEFLDQHGFATTINEAPINIEVRDTDRKIVFIYNAPLTAGFELVEEKLYFLSELELFGEKRISRKQLKPSADSEPVTFEELQLGNVVVHVTHGLGLYGGLENMTNNNVTGDFLRIDYLGGDKLYVPIDRINTVHKYKGLSDQEPKLDKLGGKAWIIAKNKVKEAVWKVAQELLDLYARRQLATGNRFSIPDEMFHELEESFPYDETRGQLKAITEVINDLTSEKVMDRLVCGDVGYGKTEVAVRAAFKVIADSRQVAILVPTTVLAEQHAATFRERFAGFPVKVASLNRFRPAVEQRRTLSGLKDGSIDIVIGTHRLLSKDVEIHKLGLLIIDEEHRFGVKHKERIKKMRAGVDVLTLTATPIPRTLQLSLLGIRDLSVISSPPRHRRSVKTFVAKFDDLVIKEAITREIQRNGQVFVVHNRVQSIQEMARRIQQLRPEARVAIAHGQMPGRALEEIMVDFVNHKIDVLVCTTIIESGLDIPNANTIIITRADRLGLAEIYQLRGRVGRSSEQAYAYLLVPSMEGLSRDAQRRLRALMDYNELGGGFKLAMSDLQIRGGGNILGESQSGNIAAVGYDLYLELLQKTVEDLKRKTGDEELLPDDEPDPEINLKLPAFIPEKYIRDTDLRYITYRKISSCRNDEALDDIRDELRDRYGALPEEVRNLLGVISLKEDLSTLKVSRLDQGEASLVLTFSPHTPINPQRLLQLIDSHRKKMRLTPDSRLVVSMGSESPADVIKDARNILHTLRQDAT